MSIFEFNANEVEPADNDFSPLPAGDYKVIITQTEDKVTSDNPRNKYLSITFDLADEGKYKGRKIFENLNLWRDGTRETDPKTVSIAQQNLSAICRAVGKMKIKDTQELCGKPILVTLKITPASGNYGAGNRITKYQSINGGNTPSAPSQEEPKKEKYPAPEPADIEDNSMPWT